MLRDIKGYNAFGDIKMIYALRYKVDLSFAI